MKKTPIRDSVAKKFLNQAVHEAARFEYNKTEGSGYQKINQIKLPKSLDKQKNL